MNNAPSTEDRIWAVLSHLSALTLGMGILLPVIGWAEQRRKSNYASFQCLQALGYQSLGYTIWVLFSLLIVLILVIIVWVLSITAGNIIEPEHLGVIGIEVFVVILFGLFILYLLLPIIAAVACAFGKDFRYPILGNRLAGYLEYGFVQKSEKQEALIEDHEFSWVAAMGHFSILILLWGLLVPLATFLQVKQSAFLKFQSMQTLVYQGITNLIFFAGMFIYLCGLFLLIGVTQTGSRSEIMGFIIFIVISLIAIMILLLMPMLHIIGQWAGYRVLKGDDYHYPLIGKLVEGWISKQANSIMEEKPT